MMTAAGTINKVRNIKANLDRGVAMRHHLLIKLFNLLVDDNMSMGIYVFFIIETNFI